MEQQAAITTVIEHFDNVAPVTKFSAVFFFLRQKRIDRENTKPATEAWGRTEA